MSPAVFESRRQTQQHMLHGQAGTCGWHRGIAAETAWVQLLWGFEPLGGENGPLIPSGKHTQNY